MFGTKNHSCQEVPTLALWWLWIKGKEEGQCVKTGPDEIVNDHGGIIKNIPRGKHLTG